MKLTRILLIVSVVILSSGCASFFIRDVTQKDPYRQFIGDAYTLTTGAYIIEDKIGRPEREMVSAGNSSWRMPDSLSEKFIGKSVGSDDYRIIDVVPAGSIVRLQKAEWSFHVEDVFYFARIELPGGKVYENVGTGSLIDGNSVPPKIGHSLVKLPRSTPSSTGTAP